MSELGSYYVTIIPSLKGAAKSIQADLGGVDTSGVGADIGSGLSKSVSKSFDVKALGTKIQSVGDAVQTVGSNMTKYLTVPIAGAAIAAGGLTATLGWGRLKSIDTAQSQLRGLGYTSEDVDRITQNLVGALEGGMMTMGEATSAAASGMAAGVQEGKELTRYIQLLDAAVVGGTGSFDEMNQIFSQTADLGYLNAQNFDMMTFRMPGFSSAVQKHMGASGDEFRKLLNDGKITTAEFMDIMEDFGGGMATAYADSWEGMVQNTLAYVGIIGQSILGGVFAQSKEAIAEFLAFLSSDEVQAWAAETGVIIGDAFARILEAVQTAIEWWTNLDTSTQKAIGAMIGIAAAAGPVLVVIGKITSAIGGILASPFVGWLVTTAKALYTASGATGAGAFLKTILRFAGPIGIAIGALVALWQNSETFRNGIMDLAMHVWDALQQIGQEFMRLWTDAVQPILALLQPALEASFGFLQTWVLPIVVSVFGFIFEIIKGVIDNVIGVISGLVDVITGIVGLIRAIFTGDWAQAWEMLKQIVMGAIKAVWNFIQLWLLGRVLKIFRGFGSSLSSFWSGLWGGIRNMVSTIWTSIGSFFSTILTGIRTLFSTIWSAIRVTVMNGSMTIQTLIRVIFGAIRSFLSTVWTAIRTVISSVWGAIRSTIGAGANYVRNIVMTAFNAVRSVVMTVMQAVRGVVLTAWNGIRAGASAAVNGMRAAIQGGFNAVVSIIRNLPTTIKNVFSNAKNFLVNAGKNIIQGLTNGIKNAIGGAVDAVKGGIQKIRNLLPFSPAKEGPLSGKGYTLYSGQALMRDFGVGMADAAPDAIRAMSEVAEEVASQTDLSAAIPDFLPTEWTTPAVPSGVASVPAPSSRQLATVGAGQSGERSFTVQGPLIEVDSLTVDSDDRVRQISQQLYQRATSADRANGRVNLGGAVR